VARYILALCKPAAQTAHVSVKHEEAAAAPAKVKWLAVDCQLKCARLVGMGRQG
jgi:hypothetical protein